ncbi:Trehalase [Klebsiella pneumoniae]|uniref:Trehalase n=1 Tax=Klebsiella pneumoniae TaxID=573 RepID=A0A2X3EI70_KLEPN|nr:Trehalase [Klebsiella pneumoniae]
MLGLAESGHWDKVEDMVANFAAEIDAWGHIPNGNRTYYLSRSQPPLLLLYGEPAGDARWRPGAENLPAAAGERVSLLDGRSDALAPGSADKRAVRMADGALLNRYWDDNDTPRPESWLDDVKTAKSNPNRPATEIYRDLRSAAASGWDFSSRWMDNPQQLATIRTTSIVPVDLNA